MQFFVRLIIPVLISIVLGFIAFKDEQHNDKELLDNLGKEHVVIRQPKSYLWIGLISSLFFVFMLCLMFLYPNDSVQPWVVILFSLFVTSGISIFLFAKFWRIEVFKSEPYFVYRPLFCKKRILYSDCTSYKYMSDHIAIKTKNRTIRIGHNVTNHPFLMAVMTQNKILEEKDEEPKGKPYKRKR